VGKESPETQRKPVGIKKGAKRRKRGGGRRKEVQLQIVAQFASKRKTCPRE